jgi:LPS sulfotransferase NodH
MLQGITTGYEDSFDFPERSGPPEKCYLLASVPRAGSTFFSHLLWSSGCLGAPLEFVNFEPSGPYGAAHGNAAEQRRYWHNALARRASPNGVFGLKTFPGQLHHLQQDNPALVDEVMRFLVGPGSSRKVVQLRRRDKTAHAISYARAMLSGIWRKEQEGEGRTEPEYSEIALQRAAKMLEQQEEGWESMYRDIGIVPLVLWFEDVLADPDAAIAQVGDYLGVSIDPAAAVAVPSIERQSQLGAKDWADKHAAS